MEVLSALLLLATGWSLLAAACRRNDLMPVTPSLTLRLTKDLTLRCHMADLQNEMDSLRGATDMRFISLQISVIFNLGSGEARPLATLHQSEGARLSPYLEDLEYSGRVIKVNGRAEEGEDMWKSWLEVTMADVSQHDFGAYVCVMYYMDAAGSSEPWNKTYKMTYAPSTPSEKHTYGFSMRWEQGLHMKCEYISDDDDPLLVKSIYFMNETDHYLGRWSRDMVGHCLANFQCAKMHSVGMYTAKRLHWYGITCRHNQANLMCGVETKYNKSASSERQRLTVDGCSARIPKDTRMLKNTTNVDGKKPVDSNPRGECACIIEKSALGIILSLGFLGFVAAACYFRDTLVSMFYRLSERLRGNNGEPVSTVG